LEQPPFSFYANKETFWIDVRISFS